MQNPLNQSQLISTLKALADQLRMEIIRILKDSSFGVQELAAIFQIPQPGMSHHLKVLSKAGLVTARREGNSLFYRRSIMDSHSAQADILISLFKTIDQTPVSEQRQVRINEIHKQRSDSATEFFNKNNEKLFENQARIVTFNQYQKAAQELIAHELPNERQFAMEIGPGEGDLLSHLAGLFDRVYALDNSQLMLQKAKSHLKSKPSNSNVVWFHGEVDTALNEGIKVSFLAINMVLHHMANPGEMFSKFYQMLGQEGVLFISDLCPHNQQWTRDACGDLWMGFDSQDIENWAISAGFILKQSQYLGLKNGFQVQLKSFLRK